jgi:hypothetical protein
MSFHILVGGGATEHGLKGCGLSRTERVCEGKRL